MRPNNIILHHSLTKDSGTVSWGAIRNYHINTCGWRDIGYHYGIEAVKGDYEILVGRFENEIGAHTYGWNYRSIGICFVGNYDIEEPKIKMLSKGIELVRYLMDVYNIPKHKVIGHREAEVKLKNGSIRSPNKTCPGNYFNMIKFREVL